MDTNEARPPVFARALPWALLAWVAASAAFFYARFSFAFVYANLDALRALWGR